MTSNGTELRGAKQDVPGSSDGQTNSTSMPCCLVSSMSPYCIISVSDDFATLVDFSKMNSRGGALPSCAALKRTHPSSILRSRRRTSIPSPTCSSHSTDELETAVCAPRLSLQRWTATIGCEISVCLLDNPMTPPVPPPQRCERSSGACIPHSEPGLNRRRHNLYVGQALKAGHHA